MAYEEWGNDESHSFTIKSTPKNPLEIERLKEKLNENLHFKLRNILTWMASENIIPDNVEYLINVSW